MSYCRFMDGDVYMFPHVRGGIECCFCSLVHGSINFRTHKEALEHLLEHRVAGHDVPEYAIRRLQEEMEQVRGECRDALASAEANREYEAGETLDWNDVREADDD